MVVHLREAELALIKCHECGKEISSLAAACPACGAPLKPAAQAADTTPVASPSKTDRREQRQDLSHDANRSTSPAAKGYVLQSLLPDERVVLETRLHWLIYFGGRFAIIIAPLLLLCVISGVGAIVPLVYFLLAFIVRRTNQFVVTNKRVIMKKGLIARRTIELGLSKVESVDVTQGIVGRLLNYGMVTLVGSGGSRERFHFIQGPLEFRRAVQMQQTS
jgi:membrane protein YdbS with pleckstrin-like domain